MTKNFVVPFSKSLSLSFLMLGWSSVGVAAKDVRATGLTATAIAANDVEPGANREDNSVVLGKMTVLANGIPHTFESLVPLVADLSDNLGNDLRNNLDNLDNLADLDNNLNNTLAQREDEDGDGDETLVPNTLRIPYFIDTELRRGTSIRESGSLNLRFPLWQQRNSYLFTDLNFTAGSGDTFLGNIGFGYRNVFSRSPDNSNAWIGGIYAFYDTKQSTNGFRYHQGSLGAEVYNRNFEFRVNGYLPDRHRNTTGTRTISDPAPVLVPGPNGLGNNITIRTFTLEAQEQSLAGFDLEAGYRHHFSDRVSLGLFGGYFHFDASVTPRLNGPMGRLQLEVQDILGVRGSLLQLGTTVQSDEIRGTDAGGFMRISFPFGGPKRSEDEPFDGVTRLARRPIERNYDISTFAQDLNRPVTLEQVLAVAAGTGSLSLEGPQLESSTQAASTFTLYFVDGDNTPGTGTQTDPFTVAQATNLSLAGDVFFLLNDVGTIDTQIGSGNSFTLKTNQELLAVGDGNSRVLTDPMVGSVTIIDSGRPQLINGASNNVVTLANGNTIDGISFDGQNTAPRAIAALNGASNTTINNVSIANFTVAGIQITPSTTTSISNTLFSNNAQDTVLNASNTTLTNLISNNAQGTAFDIANASGTTTITNLTINNPGGDGILFTNPAGTVVLNNLDISNAGNSGVEIAGGSATFDVDSASSITNTGAAALLLSNNTVGLTYNGTIDQAGNGSVLSVTNHSGGSLLLQTGTLNASNGDGFQFNNASSTYTVNSTTNFNGGDAGIDIFNSSGTFTFADTRITNPTGTAFNLADSTATVTYNSNITQANNASTVSITNHSGNPVLFQGGTLSASNGNGFQFNNANGIYTFNGTATLNGGDAGIDILNSTGTFTFNANTSITNPGGTGITIEAGAPTLTYEGSLTGTTGNTLLSIANTTGGTIDLKGPLTHNAGNGIILNNVLSNVTFAQDLTIANSGADGIVITGNSTGTFTIPNLTITNATNDSLDLADWTGGSLSIGTLNIAFSGANRGINLTNANAQVQTGGAATITGDGTIGSVGIDLTNLQAGSRIQIAPGDAANLADSNGIGIIDNVDIGVQLSGANADFQFGDGEDSTDQPSQIVATIPIDAIAVGSNGTYNFLDVKFLNRSAGRGLGDLFYVDGAGVGTGGRFDPGNVTLAEMSTTAHDVIILVNSTGADVIDTAGSNGDDTLLLQEGQDLVSFLNGDLTLPTGGPKNVLASIMLTDPTGNGAPSLTTTGAGADTVTINNENIIDGVQITASAGADDGISSGGLTQDTVTIRNSSIMATGTGIELFDPTGTVTITNNQITNAGYRGIHVDDFADSGSTTFTIANNQINNSDDDAIHFDTLDNDANVTISIDNNTVDGNGGNTYDAVEFEAITGNAIANITISNNQFTSVDNEGIQFNYIRGNSTVTIVADNNTIDGDSNTTDNGVLFSPIRDNAIANITISNNQLREISQDGMFWNDFRDGTQVNLTISNNQLTNVGFQGIEIGTFENTSQATVSIANNQLTTIGQEGIYLDDIRDGSTSTITIADNQLTSIGFQGIDFDQIYGTATTNITLSGNRLSTIGQEGIYFDNIRENGNTTLVIANNQLTNVSQEGIEFDYFEDSAIANITITNNQLANINYEGIYFDDIEDTSQVTVTLSGNQLSNVGEEGIAFDYIENSSTANITIANNQLNNVGRDGISFDDIRNNANATLMISGNTIIGGGQEGIHFDEVQDNAIATITVSGNQITAVSFQGIDFYDIEGSSTATLTFSGNTLTNVGREGIYFRDIQDNALATITLSGNQITGSARDGIYFQDITDNIGGGARLTLTVSGNTITNPAGDGVEIDHSATTNMCLSLTNNTVTSPGTTLGFNFDSTPGGGLFQIVNLDTINQTVPTNIGNFSFTPGIANFNQGTSGTPPCP